jgi:hypothetical protein
MLSSCFQPQVRELHVESRLDAAGQLIVARDRRAQQLELRRIADLSRHTGLREHRLGFSERGVRDRDELIGEHGVVVR